MAFNINKVLEELDRSFDNEVKGLDDRRLAKDYYNLNFVMDPIAPVAGYEPSKFPRFSPFLRRVIDVLTKDLYKKGPTRLLPDHPEVQEWVTEQYKHIGMDSLWQAADAMALTTDISAFYFFGNSDEYDANAAEHPVRAVLYSGDELIVYTDDEDPLWVRCVVTREMIDETRIVKIWTDEYLIIAKTDKRDETNKTAGGTAFNNRVFTKNPYGIIPFAFVHPQRPVSVFVTAGIGRFLRRANKYLNRVMTYCGETVVFTGFPILKAYKMGASWPLPNLRPGDVLQMPDVEDATGMGGQADIVAMEPALGSVEITWNDINAYKTSTYEDLGVPESVIRMVATTAKSGDAIAAEQAPLIEWAEGRQRPFAKYEADAMKVFLNVAAAWMYQNGISVSGDCTYEQIREAAFQPGLDLRWPDMHPGASGKERDDAEQWEYDNKITSLTQIVMERQKISEDEAVAYLTKIAEQRKMERELFSDEEAANPFMLAAQQEQPQVPLDESGNPVDPKAKAVDLEDEELTNEG